MNIYSIGGEFGGVWYHFCGEWLAFGGHWYPFGGYWFIQIRLIDFFNKLKLFLIFIINML